MEIVHSRVNHADFDALAHHAELLVDVVRPSGVACRDVVASRQAMQKFGQDESRS